MLEIPWQKPEEIEKEKQQVQDHLIMQFFRDYIGPFLMKKPIKVFLFVVVYIQTCFISIVVKYSRFYCYFNLEMITNIL